MSLKNIISIILILLILFEIGFSGVLAYKDYLKKDVGICSLNNSCNNVQDSSYGKIFGVKLPYLAVIAFTILLILFFLIRKIFLIGTFIGTIISGYLIYIQLFVLKQVCVNCMIIDGTMFIICIFSFFLIKEF